MRYSHFGGGGGPWIEREDEFFLLNFSRDLLCIGTTPQTLYNLTMFWTPDQSLPQYTG